MQTPILIYSDSPCKTTGLARITRDLAFLISTLPETKEHFRVATYGHFGHASRRLPWQQYCCDSYEDGQKHLKSAWEDWSDGYRGVLLTITPPSWIFWLACPEYAYKNDDGTQNKEFKPISDWLLTKPFDVWSYLAIETCSWKHTFNTVTQSIIKNVARPLFYTQWGCQVASNTPSLADMKLEWNHHGLWMADWQRASEQEILDVRTKLNMGEEDLLIGCVATNSLRKRLGLLFPMLKNIKETLGSQAKVKLWLHTDVMQREWSLQGLIADFGFTKDDVYITSSLAERPDAWMCLLYSACNVTVLPTLGEGFGYPVLESLACGTPVVTGDFGGQMELLSGLRRSWIVSHQSEDIDGVNSLLKVSYSPDDFASAVLRAWAEMKPNQFSSMKLRVASECREHAMQWDWGNIWPHWAKWLLAGLEGAPEVEILKEEMTVGASPSP